MPTTDHLADLTTAYRLGARAMPAAGADHLARLTTLTREVAEVTATLAHLAEAYGATADHTAALLAAHDAAHYIGEAAREAGHTMHNDGGRPTVTVRHLAEGETMADPASTKRRIVGPCAVTLTRWPDGGTEAVVADA